MQSLRVSQPTTKVFLTCNIPAVARLKAHSDPQELNSCGASKICFHLNVFSQTCENITQEVSGSCAHMRDTKLIRT